MMTSYRILTGAFVCLSSANAFAQNKQKANIEHITVFLSGAEIESSTKVNLPQGESEVLFTNIAGNIVQQSISVGVNNGVIVQSATPQNDFLVSSNLSPKGQMIKDSIEYLIQQGQTLADKKTVLDEQLSVIKENRKIAGVNNGLSVVELQKMLDLINAKMNGLLTEGHLLNRQINKTNERINLLNQQLNEEQKKDFQPGGQLLVKFFTTQATAATVSINYVTPNASWTPSYDLRVDKINSPVKLVYKANIVQNSGVKWDNVQLSLSTGNPNEGAEAPAMNPWKLSFYETQPNYGYLNKSSAESAAESVAKPDLRIRGGRANATVYMADSVTVQSPVGGGIENYVQIDNSGINTTFDISLNYTIPSDGLAHLVAVKDYELPATYRYYVAPKLDRDAFLQARITNWEDLNLMPAATNIFYEGAYVGQGYIDMRNVKDTLNLSLGRDKKIIVRRENDKNYRSVKMIGTNVRRSYGYTIEVRNSKKEPIDLVVLEQFPISNDKDISIEDKEAKDAQINEETGAVQWGLSLKGNEPKTLKLNYSVKYPKDKTVGNL
ncbi:MAG: DUF4139 domain-containing protein [Phycisphaerales bacterium]|nr:DUF4139 domain-containing protein [Phycisphaerales bacterium]